VPLLMSHWNSMLFFGSNALGLPYLQQGRARRG
jgi:hypothetical protein